MKLSQIEAGIKCACKLPGLGRSVLSTPRSIRCLLLINYEVSNNVSDRGYTHKHTNNITITLIQAAEELFDNLFL